MTSRRFAPSRFIPENSEERKHPHGLGVVYTYANAKGQPLAVAYAGKGAKAVWHFRFRSPEGRDQKIADLWLSLNARAQRKAERRVEAQRPTGAKVGDVLYTSWGYDQTNVEFFEVVAVRGKVVDLRERKQSYVETGFMSGRCQVAEGYVGEILRGKRPRPNGERGYTVRICSTRTAWLDLPGTTHYSSSYA